MKGNWSTVPTKHFARAREMRNEMTSAESCLWQAIRRSRLGVSFRRQHPVGPYIADFYCGQLRLVVEVDGDTHHAEDEQEYDGRRDEYMRLRGLTVKRFQNEAILYNIKCVLDELEKIVGGLKQPPCGPPVIQGDGASSPRITGGL